MAKRRRAKSAQVVRYVSPTVRQAAPIIRIQQSRSPSAPSRSRKKHRRHHRRSAGSGRLTPNTVLGAAIGGAVFGFVEKTFPNLPTLPIVGRAGTIAIAGYFLGGMAPAGMRGIVRDMTLAAAAVAGFELGNTGHISGDIPGQVRGIASQV